MPYIFCFILLIISTPVLSQPELQPYFSINSFSHSEPTAISAIGDEWDEKLYPGDVAFSINRLEAGINWKQWQIGLLQRYEAFYQFSPDTADLLYTIERRELTPGDQYDVQLSANSLIAGGLRIAYLQPVGDFNLGMALSYLHGRDFIYGTGLSGNAQVISDRDYDLNFDVDYFYSEDKLFGRQAPSPRGRGYAVDFTADWKPNKQWYFKLDMIDLWAAMKWQDALRTVASADTDTKEYDADGYVVFRPVASGIETTQDFTQKIPAKIFFKMRYSLSNGYPVLFEYDDYQLKQFVTLGTAYTVDNKSKLGFFYNVTARALKIRYQNQWLKFELISDELSPYKARTFGLQLNMIYRY